MWLKRAIGSYWGFALLLLCMVTATVHAERYYVFIGSYNWHRHRAGLHVYALDTLTGKLTNTCVVKNILNPAFVVMSPNGQCLYACTEAQIEGGGTVSSFAFNEQTGTLTYLNQQNSGGENPVYLSVHRNGKWLVGANYTGGSAVVFPLGAEGEIGAACQVIAFNDSSIDPERQNHSHVHAAVFSPLQDYVYFPDLGADKIRCFGFDTARSAPLVAAVPTAVACVAGSGPRHMAFHPNGHYAYCTEEMGGAITAYRYRNGQLDSIQRIPTHQPSLTGTFSNADIHLSPDGRFLYASSRGKENKIVIFAVDEHTGLLTQTGYAPTLGNHPRNFAIDPTGRFLLVANQISGDVVVFRRDAATGALLPTGNKIKIRGASCINIRKYGA